MRWSPGGGVARWSPRPSHLHILPSPGHRSPAWGLTAVGLSHSVCSLWSQMLTTIWERGGCCW